MNERIPTDDEVIAGEYTDGQFLAALEELDKEREKREEQEDTITTLQANKDALSLDLGLMETARNQKHELLESCETALGERDAEIYTLQAEVDGLRQAADKSAHQITIKNLRTVNAELRAEVERLKASVPKAYQLGQSYWRLADSDSYSDHKKAEEIEKKYKALTEPPQGERECKGNAICFMNGCLECLERKTKDLPQ